MSRGADNADGCGCSASTAPVPFDPSGPEIGHSTASAHDPRSATWEARPTFRGRPMRPLHGGDAAAQSHRDPAMASNGRPVDRGSRTRILEDSRGVVQGSDEELMRLAASEWPPRERYDYLGLLRPRGDDLWIHSSPGARSVEELMVARGISRRPPTEEHGDRGILVSADGRCFIEQEWVVRRRIGAARLGRRRELGDLHASHRVPVRPPLESSRTPRAAGWPGQADLGFANDAGALDAGWNALPGGDLAARPHAIGDTEFGSDSRELLTSDQFPWSAVAVAVMDRNDNSGAYSGCVGSAVMIGPRAALTVAHNFSENGSEHTRRGVAPARRGVSWSDDTAPGEGLGNSKYPHGVRRVKWYLWPQGWDGDSNRYDYGVLILWDQPYMPGYIRCGSRAVSDLDYNNANLTGYPLVDKICVASPLPNGHCNCYAYFEYGETTSGGANLIYHQMDAQEGQSGAPLYWYEGDERRVVYMLHKGSEGDYAYAKRIRGGNYDSICEWRGDFPSAHYENPECG